MRHLELIRRVEADRFESDRGKSSYNLEKDIAEKDFGERWVKLVQDYADRPENDIFLESFVFSKPKVKVNDDNKVDDLIESFLNNLPEPKATKETAVDSI